MKLQDDVEAKSAIIKSLEASQKTMSDLLSDKNAVIESQQLIIDGIKNKCITECAEKQKEFEKKLEERDQQILGYKEKIAQHERDSRSEDVEDLIRQIHSEREANAHLTSKLCDQTIITEKTEFALEKLEELVSTKSLLIENLQSVIAHHGGRHLAQPVGRRKQI